MEEEGHAVCSSSSSPLPFPSPNSSQIQQEQCLNPILAPQIRSIQLFSASSLTTFSISPWVFRFLAPIPSISSAVGVFPDWSVLGRRVERGKLRSFGGVGGAVWTRLVLAAGQGLRMVGERGPVRALRSGGIGCRGRRHVKIVSFGPFGRFRIGRWQGLRWGGLCWKLGLIPLVICDCCFSCLEVGNWEY